MANTGELSSNLKKIVTSLFPELNGYSLASKAKVVKVHEQAGQIDAMRKVYSVDLQPLKSDGSVDEQNPVIPDVEIPVWWAGNQRGIFCLPQVGSIVRLAYYYNDPSFPYVDAILGEGYAVPEHALGSIIIQHSEGVKIEITKDSKINIITKDDIQITTNKKISLQADSINLDSDKIKFTSGGSHPVAFADVVKQVFDGHTHPGVHGETGAPTQKMAGHASAKVSTG